MLFIITLTSPYDEKIDSVFLLTSIWSNADADDDVFKLHCTVCEYPLLLFLSLSLSLSLPPPQ